MNREEDQDDTMYQKFILQIFLYLRLHLTVKWCQNAQTSTCPQITSIFCSLKNGGWFWNFPTIYPFWVMWSFPNRDLRMKRYCFKKHKSNILVSRGTRIRHISSFSFEFCSCIWYEMDVWFKQRYGWFIFWPNAGPFNNLFSPQPAGKTLIMHHFTCFISHLNSLASKSQNSLMNKRMLTHKLPLCCAKLGETFHTKKKLQSN